MASLRFSNLVNIYAVALNLNLVDKYKFLIVSLNLHTHIKAMFR